MPPTKGEHSADTVEKLLHNEAKDKYTSEGWRGKQRKCEYKEEELGCDL